MSMMPSRESERWPHPQETILVVDDDAAIRLWFAAHLKAQGYLVAEAGSGEEALVQAAELRPDLILLDIMMPGMNGYEVSTRLKDSSATKATPIIMITQLGDTASRMHGLEAGADEFITKPAEPGELLLRVRNLLRIKAYGDELARRNQTLEEEVRHKTEEVRAHCIETVLALMRAAEYRDEVTGTHVARISRYCRLVCERLGMDRGFTDRIYYASPMHDIGKLAIPDDILGKPGHLTAEEWAVMRTHTLLGKKILEGSSSPYLTMGADIALYHHECWDGSGYPFGLKGEDIPLAARVMAICDVYDALRSQRPYKHPLSHDDALAILRHGDERTRPERFDPEVLTAFFAESTRFDDIFRDTHDPASHPATTLSHSRAM